MFFCNGLEAQSTSSVLGALPIQDQTLTLRNPILAGIRGVCHIRLA